MNTLTYRTPYRRAYKTPEGERRIELRDGTDITITEWQNNIATYRIVNQPDDDPTVEDPS